MNADNVCAICNKVYRSESDFLTETRRWRVCSQGNLWFNCRCGSTLMVKKGKFPWYSPDKNLSEEARGVFNRLGNLKDLPHIPSIVMELQRLLQDPALTPKVLATAVRREPILATQIMQVAEGLQRVRNPANPPIHSLEHAIVYVGYRTLGDILMKCGLKTFAVPASGFDQEAFWRESAVTGALAEALARRFAATLPPDEVYLAGTLCNVGKLVTAICFPPLATKIARDVADPHTLMTWRQAEKAYQFPDHSILGEIAAALWGLPEYIMQATRRHHDPIPAGKGLDLFTLAGVANQMTHWVLLQPHRIEQSVLDAFATAQKLTADGMDALAMELTKLKDAVLAPAIA